MWYVPRHKCSVCTWQSSHTTTQFPRIERGHVFQAGESALIQFSNVMANCAISYHRFYVGRQPLSASVLMTARMKNRSFIVIWTFLDSWYCNDLKMIRFSSARKIPCFFVQRKKHRARNRIKCAYECAHARLWRRTNRKKNRDRRNGGERP